MKAMAKTVDSKATNNNELLKWSFDEMASEWTREWKEGKRTAIEASVFEVSKGSWTASIDIDPHGQKSMTVTLNFTLSSLQEAMEECGRLAQRFIQ
jgi:hypothetical protein